MAKVEPVELTYLRQSQEFLSSVTSEYELDVAHEVALQVLEAAGCLLGGIEFGNFKSVFRLAQFDGDQSVQNAGRRLVEVLPAQMHPALALSALAREELDSFERKTTGTYHTDFRLAQKLASDLASKISPKSRVIDPACGAGILVVALVIEMAQGVKSIASQIIAEQIFVADLSPASIRSTRLALAALTSDVNSLAAFTSRAFQGDSLTELELHLTQRNVGKFDALIVNPPWAKLKQFRAMFGGAMASPQTREASLAYESAVRQTKTYTERLRGLYPMLQGSDLDLYAAFIELSLRLVVPGGAISLILPGGFLRSQGTSRLRSSFLERASTMDLAILNNRSRFFAIDTRFKFLMVTATLRAIGQKKIASLSVSHDSANPIAVQEGDAIQIPVELVTTGMGDLVVPEVKTMSDWELYKSIASSATNWEKFFGDAAPTYCRELDMTNDKALLRSENFEGAMPVVEGRMVQIFHFGAKTYEGGTGRRAIWSPVLRSGPNLKPQFFVSPNDLAPAKRVAANSVRIGFCDVTGQTNERTVIAALLPPGCVAGNKVPTLTFAADPDSTYLLLGIMNSLVFDWLTRRVITTSLNYFILKSSFLPSIDMKSDLAIKIARLAKQLSAPGDLLDSRREAMRASLDALVAASYGLSTNEMEIVFNDFPLLDRGQKPLPGETKSTVTRDLTLAALAKEVGQVTQPWEERARSAQLLGARAFVPAEFV